MPAGPPPWCLRIRLGGARGPQGAAYATRGARRVARCGTAWLRARARARLRPCRRPRRAPRAPTPRSPWRYHPPARCTLRPPRATPRAPASRRTTASRRPRARASTRPSSAAPATACSSSARPSRPRRSRRRSRCCATSAGPSSRASARARPGADRDARHGRPRPTTARALAAARAPDAGRRVRRRRAPRRRVERAPPRARRRARRVRRPRSGSCSSASPLWHLVGRVCFHLAERKGDEAAPSPSSRPTPPGVSAAARRAAPPARPRARRSTPRAADRGRARWRCSRPCSAPPSTARWCARWSTRDEIFHPLAWTPAAGPRLPARGALAARRPASSCACPTGGTPAARRARGCRSPSAAKAPVAPRRLDALLDFDVAVALDDDAVSPPRRSRVARSTPRASCCCAASWVEVDPAAPREVLAPRGGRSSASARDGVSVPRGHAAAGGRAPGRAPPAPSRTPRTTRSRVAARRGRALAARRARRPARSRVASGDTRPGPGAARDAAAVPAGGRALALVPHAAGPRRLPRRRHGPRQDHAGARAARCCEKREAARRRAAAACWWCRPRCSPTGRRRLARFAPSLRVLVAHPSRDARRGARRRTAAPEARRRRPRHHHLRHAARACRGCAARAWRLVILDEAQAIKNPGAKQTRAVKALAAARAPRAHRHAGREPRSATSGRSSTSSTRVCSARRTQFSRASPSALAQRGHDAATRRCASWCAPTSCAASRPTSASSPTCPTRPRSRRYCALTPHAGRALPAGRRRAGRASSTSADGHRSAGAWCWPSSCASSRSATTRRSGSGDGACEPSRQRQVRAPARARRGHRRAPGEGARLHPVPRDDRAAGRVPRRRSSARPGLVLHGGTPVKKRKATGAALPGGRRRCRSSCCRSRPAAPGSTSPRPRTSSTSTAGGTRRSRTRPPTAPSASARSGTCWCTSSSAAARSRSDRRADRRASSALAKELLDGGRARRLLDRDDERRAAATSSRSTCARPRRRTERMARTRWPEVAVRRRLRRLRAGGRAPPRRPHGGRQALQEGGARGRRRSSSRAATIAQHVLGQGLVRQPRALQRLREPPAARPHLRAQRLGDRPADRARARSSALVSGSELYTVDDRRSRRSPQRALDRRLRPDCAGRSTRSSSCCRASSPRA